MFHCSLDYDVLFSSLITKDVSYLLCLVFTFLIAEAVTASLPRKSKPSLCFALSCSAPGEVLDSLFRYMGYLLAKQFDAWRNCLVSPEN